MYPLLRQKIKKIYSRCHGYTGFLPFFFFYLKMHSPQSTVIFVHSTAHWEAIQKQRAQLLGVKPEPEPAVKKERKTPLPPSVKSRKYNVGSETSRRRKRWVNSK